MILVLQRCFGLLHVSLPGVVDSLRQNILSFMLKDTKFLQVMRNICSILGQSAKRSTLKQITTCFFQGKNDFAVCLQSCNEPSVMLNGYIHKKVEYSGVL
jgi:hypothetical protein